MCLVKVSPDKDAPWWSREDGLEWALPLAVTDVLQVRATAREPTNTRSVRSPRWPNPAVTPDQSLLGVDVSPVHRNKNRTQYLVLLAPIQSQLADELLLLVSQVASRNVAPQYVVSRSGGPRLCVEVAGLHLRRDAELPLLIEEVAYLVVAAGVEVRHD